MAEEPQEKPADKAEAEEQPRPKKPPGYRKFEDLLKRVVNAPPLRKKNDATLPAIRNP